MRLLLDTNVVSEARRVSPDPRVQARISALNDEDTFVSVITVGELAYGIQRLAAGQKRRKLEEWLATLQSMFASRVLAVDVETALIWGEIVASAEGKGRPLRPQDGLIAATAIRHGLHLWTRNVRDFEATGVLVSSPWDP
ncbi:MAG: type II toxin-antitoxin system VapC family toxin [Phycisphaerales bacterium]|nr:type II toxin-antitoxin system VapC family toxin [Phycisphaerales bacterium]